MGGIPNPVPPGENKCMNSWCSTREVLLHRQTNHGVKPSPLVGQTPVSYRERGRFKYLLAGFVWKNSPRLGIQTAGMSCEAERIHSTSSVMNAGCVHRPSSEAWCHDTHDIHPEPCWVANPPSTGLLCRVLCLLHILGLAVSPRTRTHTRVSVHAKIKAKLIRRCISVAMNCCAWQVLMYTSVWECVS